MYGHHPNCLEEAGLIEEDQRTDQYPEQEDKPRERDEYEAMEAAAPRGDPTQAGLGT